MPEEQKKPEKAQEKAKTKLSYVERARILTRKNVIDICQLYGLQKEGWVYRYVNAEGSREPNVDKFETIGYAKCYDKDGNVIRRRGQITGVSQILMRIPEEDYNKIQYHKLEEVREVERSLGKRGVEKFGSPDTYYGKVETKEEVFKGR